MSRPVAAGILDWSRAAVTVAVVAVAGLGGAPTARADALDTVYKAARTLDRINRVANGFSEIEQAVRDFTGMYEMVQDVVMNDPVARALILGTARLYEGSLSYTAYGAVIADSSQYTALAAGAELAWDAPLCRFGGAGGDIQLFRDNDDAGLAATAHATGCIPLPANTPELTYRLQRSVRPSLAARPVLRPGRYSSDTGVLALAFYKWRGDVNHLDFMPLNLELGVTRELEGDGGDEVFHAEVDIHTVRWRRPRRGFLGGTWAIDFFHARIATLEDATVGWFAPLRLDAVPLGGGLYLDAEVAYTGGDLAVAGMDQNAVLFRTAGVDVSLKSGLAYRHGGLRYERKIEPTTFSAFLLDDRISTWVTWQSPVASLTVRGFVASTSVVDAVAFGPRILTGGGAAEFAYAITPTASFSLEGELARSFFARVDTGLAAPELGFRALAVLSTTVDSGP